MQYTVGQSYKALLDDNVIHTFEIIDIGKGCNAGMYAVQFDEDYRQWVSASTIEKYVKKALKAKKGSRYRKYRRAKSKNS